MLQNRKQTHGNSKFQYISGVCKGLVEVFEKTDIEYDDDCVQTFLKTLARETRALLTEKFKKEID